MYPLFFVFLPTYSVNTMLLLHTQEICSVCILIFVKVYLNFFDVLKEILSTKKMLSISKMRLIQPVVVKYNPILMFSQRMCEPYIYFFENIRKHILTSCQQVFDTFSIYLDSCNFLPQSQKKHV